MRGSSQELRKVHWLLLGQCFLSHLWCRHFEVHPVCCGERDLGSDKSVKCRGAPSTERRRCNSANFVTLDFLRSFVCLGQCYLGVGHFFKRCGMLPGDRELYRLKFVWAYLASLSQPTCIPWESGHCFTRCQTILEAQDVCITSGTTLVECFSFSVLVLAVRRKKKRRARRKSTCHGCWPH